MSHPWLAVSFQLRHEVSGILSIQSHFNVGYPVSTSWGLVSSKWGFESQNAWLLTELDDFSYSSLCDLRDDRLEFLYPKCTDETFDREIATLTVQQL